MVKGVAKIMEAVLIFFFTLLFLHYLHTSFLQKQYAEDTKYVVKKIAYALEFEQNFAELIESGNFTGVGQRFQQYLKGKKINVTLSFISPKIIVLNQSEKNITLLCGDTTSVYLLSPEKKTFELYLNGKLFKSGEFENFTSFALPCSGSAEVRIVSEPLLYAIFLSERIYGKNELEAPLLFEYYIFTQKNGTVRVNVYIE